MKQARRARWTLALCTIVLLLSGGAALAHPALAFPLVQAGSPTPTVAQASTSLIPNRKCAQPPTNVDHATLSNAELDTYGLPRYRPGKGKAAWQELVRAMKHRVCGGTPTHYRNSFASGHSADHHVIPQTPSPTCQPYNVDTSGDNMWTGNITVNAANDGYCTQNNTYTEADAVFYVPCINQYSPPGSESSWVGLGGYGNPNLVQAGTQADTAFDFSTGSTLTSYFAWTENTAASNRNEVYLFTVNCNDRMFVQVYANVTYIEDYNTGDYTTSSYGPDASTDTAEWIVERPSSGCDPTCTPSSLADFQSETFYGMGTTVGSGYCSGCYVSPADVDHVYSNMNGRTTIGPLAYDTAWGPPNYKNTMTWVSS